MQRRRSVKPKRKSSSTVARPRPTSQIADKNVILERIIGSTIKTNNSISINPITDEIAYIAGNVVIIYDPEQQKQTHFLKNGTGKTIISIKYSSDGKFLAVGEKGKNPSTFIWKLVNRRKPFLITKLTSHRYGIKTVSFAEGNTIVITCGDHDKTVCIWNISHCINKKDDNSNSPLQELTAPVITQRVKSEILSCVYMKENQIFVTTGESHVKSWCIDKLLQSDRRSRLSDIHESKDVGVSIPVRAAVLGTFRNSLFVDICCYLDRIYVITPDGHLYALTMATANNRGRLIIEKAINLKTPGASSVSVNSRFISISFSNGMIRLVDRQTLEYLGALPKPKQFGQESKLHSSAINLSGHDAIQEYPDTIACCLSPGKENLFAAYSDGSFTSWQLAEFPKVHKNFTEYSHNQCIWDMKLIDQGNQNLEAKTLVTCSADNTIRFWDTEKICDPSFDSQSSLQGIIHTDESYAALRKDSPATASGLRCLAISSNGKHLASGDRQGNIRVHDLESFSLLDYKEAHDSEVLSLAYAPGDDLLLASASRDRLIHLFSCQNEQKPKILYSHVDTLDDHSSSITAIHFDKVPSGCDKYKLQFASCGADKSIIFRNIDYSPDHRHFSAERFATAVLSGTVYDMSLDNTTHSILTTGKDKKLTRFDLLSGKQIGDPITAARDSDEIIKLSIHNSGEFALTSSIDKCVRMYSCSSSDCSTEKLRGVDKENSLAVPSRDSSRRVSIASKCLLVANGPSFITSTCFSPCSSRIFGTSADGMIFVWRVSPTLVQKLSRNLQSPISSILSPRRVLSLRSHKPKKSTNEEKEKKQLQPSTWIDAEEIESSLVSEYGLASKPKTDGAAFGFLSVFSNDDDAKVQALRRLTIEPSSEEIATVADSAALASALSGGGAEEENSFFDFGNFSDIPDPSPLSSRLSLSRAFRQNSSPLPKKLFMTPNHSPIQVATPMNAAPIPVASPMISTKLNRGNESTKSPEIHSGSSTPRSSPATAISPSLLSEPLQCKEVKNSRPEDENFIAGETKDSVVSENLSAYEEKGNSDDIEVVPEPGVLAELSSLLGAHNQQIAETKQLLEKSSVDDCEQNSASVDDNLTSPTSLQHEESCDGRSEENQQNNLNSNSEEMEEATQVEEEAAAASYDLQVRHQVALNLLQNAFENAMQLYEDANFEYECIRKEDSPSPYLPVYEQILDNYESSFHSLANKLSETPTPQPSASPQLEQYSSMLVHLASLIKEKQIVP